MIAKRLFAGVTLLALVACGAASETHEIVLEDSEVSTQRVVARVGDTLKIYHRDAHGDHALYSVDEKHRFDLSDMKHGDHYDLPLDHPREFTIECHNMHDMKIEVVVTE